MVKKLMEERRKLKTKVVGILEKFNIKYIKTSGLFDIIAKLNDRTIFVKVIYNIDSITEITAKNLSNISYSLNAYTIVVGRRTRICELRNDIIYKRFDIPCMNVASFERFVSGSMPTVESFRGGEFVHIDPEKLKKARVEKGITQDELAKMVGVSKKCIYEHEHEVKKAKKEVADAISRILEFPITTRMNMRIQNPQPMSPRTMFERIVYKYFSKIGMNVNYINGSSFNIVAKDEMEVLTYAHESIARYKINLLKSVSDFLERPALLVSEGPVDSDVPNLSKDELKELSKRKLKRLVR